MEGRILGILWSLLIALLVGVYGWLLTSCLVPYLDAAKPDYLLLLRPFTHLAAWCVVTVAVLSVARRRYLRDLSPLLLLFAPVVAVAILATPLRPYAAPWLYVAFDLKWWLLATIAALIVQRIGGASLTASLRRSLDRVEAAAAWPGPRAWFDLSLAAVLVTSSLLSSPPLRFQSVLIGDEPKYLRYLENWYRGRGMDVSDLGPIADLPVDSAAHLSGNLVLLRGAARRVVTDLIADGRRAVGLRASPPPGPARSEGGWFVAGKRGGIYQVHNPGISLLLLPGYLIDRGILSHTHVWHPQFPTDLYATNLILLLVYVLWGLALFRLVWTYTGKAGVSWLLTCVVFLSLPTTAFVYQYYPETAAGLVVVLLVRYGVLSSDGRHAPAFGYGLLAGFLPWLHLRFLPLTIAAVVAVALTRRRDGPAIGWFAAGVALPLLLLGGYYYHVTGSMMPWALYALTQDGALFSTARVWRDLPSLWFDRTWGLIAHAPVFLCALPGLWLAWRRDKFAATAVGLVVLAVAVPAAGHGYTGAFTTPSRLVAAVVPLLALPLADAVIAFASSRWFVALFGLLGVVSVQNGLTYNVHLIKSDASLQGSTIGGWLFPLLLPDFDAAHRLAQPLTILWIVVCVGLLSYPVLVARRRTGADVAQRRWSPTAVVASAVVVFAIASSLTGAAFGAARFKAAFMLKPGDARDRLIHFALTDRPSLQWSSENGRVDLTSYFPNPDGTTTTLSIQPQQPHVNTAVELAIAARRPGNRPGWGTALVDFGDGSPLRRVPIEGEGRGRHVYARAGTYLLRIELDLWGLPGRSVTESIRVGQD